MHKMQKLEYTVTFNTPAFLGNAEQQAQWRTPPFKALLRQWWRIAAAAEHGYDYKRLRTTEGPLFGHAWLENDRYSARKSQVRLRLNGWAQGKLRGAWGNDPAVHHPEVGPGPGGRKVGSHLYLGYGPLTYQKGVGTALKANAGIQAGESNALRLALPSNENTLPVAIQLIHWLGTVGGRSRNGWGSVALERAGDPSLENPPHETIQHITRPLRECLALDWPHALGTSDDGRLLVWRSSENLRDWRTAMQFLARAKIAFRTQFALSTGHGPFTQRHLVAYPVTNHSVSVWGNQARLANQLRFKVERHGESAFRALVYHLPCALPQALAEKLGERRPSLEAQKAIWQQIHDWLDGSKSGFDRIEGWS